MICPARDFLLLTPRLAFDDSSTHRGGGIEVVLYDPDGTIVSLSFKLELPCFNKEGEHGALIVGLASVLHRGIQSFGLRN